MPRHARTGGGPWRLVRGLTLVVVWLCGLAAGFFAILSAAAKYTTCSRHATGLACRASGSGIGIAIVVAVILVVAIVTATTYARAQRGVVLVGAGGVAALIGCLVAARSLLGTA